MGLRTRLDRLDLLLPLVLIPASLLTIARYGLSMLPAEDAMILMRYSAHLAGGHGIVWNIGAKPVDGATDFLFMVLLAALTRLGVAVEVAARMVGAVSHIATVLIIYAAVRRMHSSPRWAAFVSAAYLALGPGMGYVAAGFGTTFFALSVCIAWYLASMLAQEPSSRVLPSLFAISCLVMGLIRPEGVILAALMLAAIAYMKGLREARLVITHFVAAFTVFGSAYLVWRWRYFGYPLPNPFYVKGGGHAHLSGLLASVWNTLVLSLPFAAAFVAGFRSPGVTRKAVFALIPVVGFTLAWVMLSDEMNYMRRFQYPILPIVLMSWAPAMRGFLAEYGHPRLGSLDRRTRATAIALISMVAAFILVLEQAACKPLPFSRMGNYEAAMILRSYRGRGYTIAVSEAGLLPFYSEWRSVDTWGLNDQWIAHNGRVTEVYLDRYHPEVIMFHASFSPLTPPASEDGPIEERRFRDMTLTLKHYAEMRGYTLAASFGETPYDTHYYYVRPDFPDSQQIAERIRRMDYTWWSTGRRSVNFAATGAR